MIVTLLLVLATALADTSVSVTAAQPDTSAAPVPVLTLPEVRVEQERPALDARHRQPTGFVSDVRAGETGHAVETLAELVSRSAAVRIQQYGGLGSFATVSIRGAPAGQLSVYMDGVPITSSAGRLVDFSALPVSIVDRLEVYRGPSPLELGPPTPGGAINLVSLPPSNLRHLRLQRGSFDTWQGDATAGVAHGRWSALLHAGYQGSQGNFGYWDDNGTPFNPDDDGESSRQNNRFDSRVLLATTKGPLPWNAGFTLQQQLYRKTQGVPGLGAVPALGTQLGLDRAIGQLSLERPTGRRAPSIGAQLSWDRSRTRFRDPNAELGAGTYDTDDRIGSDLLRVVSRTPRIANLFAVDVSASRREERSELHDAASSHPDPAPGRRVTQGVSALVALEPGGGPVSVRAGRRWDRQEDDLHWNSSLGIASASTLERELDSPQLGARVRLHRLLELRGNWSKSQRAPEFVELFGNEGSIRGNPLLKPEGAESWDAGASGRFDLAGVGGTVEWAHYEQHAQDLIAYARNSASTVKALNISRARIRGEELTLRITAPMGLSAHGYFDWQSTMDEGASPITHGRRLPQRPERHLMGQLTWRGGPLELSSDVEYIGENYEDAANRVKVPARTLAGVSAGVHVWRGAKTMLEIKNLSDQRVADVAGFPLPGRSLFLSCEWQAVPRTHP